MNKKRDNQYILDFSGLISLGIFSLGYIVFVRTFAELNIQLSFLDFPIFVGEILLFLCLCLFLMKGNLQYSNKCFWVIGYFIFVVVKALYGYSKLGPLAFRDAALFYYPAFIFLANSFYRREFFDNSKSAIIFAIIVFLFVTQKFEGYWLITCLSLAFILSCTFSKKTVRYVLLGILFLSAPYKLFFATSRMMMVANFFACLYLIASFYLILKIKRPIKIGIAILTMLFILSALFLFSDRNALKAIVRGDKIIEEFKQKDWEFRAIHAKVIPPIPGTYLDDGYVPNDTNQPLLYNSDLARKFEKPDLGESTIPKDKATGKELIVEKNKLNIIRQKGGGEEKKAALKTQSQGIITNEKIVEAPERRNIEVAYQNAVFRLFIWRDMVAELLRAKPIFGFDFGKPLRSITLETLRWGEGDWKRDGWIGAHNSFLHMIYRAGIIGILFLGQVFHTLYSMIQKSIRYKSVTGILLCGIIINWFVAANFLLILELPYTSIPIWALFGLTYAYVSNIKPLST